MNIFVKYFIQASVILVFQTEGAYRKKLHGSRTEEEVCVT